MNIRFVSSLTPEDEERLAPGIVNALGMLLDQVPIAYTLRIETANGKLFQHAHAGPDVVAPEMPAEPVRLNSAAPARPRTPVP